jgi:hypothetical protein
VDQESTSTDTPEGGQAPPNEGEGSKPNADAKSPKTFDEAYVKTIRREAASARTELQETKSKLQELLDRDKTDAEKLSERLAASERQASEATLRALRYEVAAEHGLDLKTARFVTGDSKEAMTETAKELADLLESKRAAERTAGGFDGGARERPAEKGSPTQEHNALLLAAMGRANTP